MEEQKFHEEDITKKNNENAGGKRLAPYSFKTFWEGWGDVVVFLAIVFVLFKVVFQIAWVPSGSMETTIPTKSLLICWRLPYMVSDPLPEHGDVMTFKSDELQEILIKRAIGLPGDVISFQDGYVYRNGVMLVEPYVLEQGTTYGNQEFTVPEGCVFFMGDNRMGSLDARYWYEPYINRSELQAKALIAFSFGESHAWQGVRIIGK